VEILARIKVGRNFKRERKKKKTPLRSTRVGDKLKNGSPFVGSIC
jgi:hypothetical protein